MAKEFGGPGVPLDMIEIFKKTIAPLPLLIICIDVLDWSPPKD